MNITVFNLDGSESVKHDGVQNYRVAENGMLVIYVDDNKATIYSPGGWGVAEVDGSDG